MYDAEGFTNSRPQRLEVAFLGAARRAESARVTHGARFIAHSALRLFSITA